MSEPCQVDFYVLTGRDRTPEQLACQLALMAWEQGHRISIMTENDSDASRLDDLMWEFPPKRFLPHGMGDEAGDVPVRIAARSTPLPQDRDVIINLATTPVQDPARFRRLLEIVPPEPEQRQQSRAKFKHYRELGLTPGTHEIGKA